MTSPSAPPPSRPASRLGEVARVFLRLGALGFGGPAAHVALMEAELVRRRRWVSPAEFLDLLAATNLIPGPNSTEMAIHLGYRRAGPAGLLVAGTCFILPAAILVTAMAWSYREFGGVPAVASAFRGIRAVLVVVIAQAVLSLARSGIRSRRHAAIALAALAASLAGVNELALLALAGAVGVAVGGARSVARPSERSAASPPEPFPSAAPLALAAAAAAPAGFALGPMFVAFLKIGSVLFGSGYVLVAFLRADFVERLGWLGERQLLDAVAVGQVTPGPLLTTATFIGYLLGGLPGAGLATVGIFLPAFVFVALSAPWIPRLRRSRAAGAVLDGLVAGSLALMAAATVGFARLLAGDPFGIALALAAAALLFAARVNPGWVILGAGLAGTLAGLLRA